MLWYATRATGEVALLFLTIVLALGAASAVRIGGRRVPRFVIAGMHRNLTLAGLGFLAVHIVTTILDSYAPIGLVDAVVPFVSAYRPIWLGLGTVAFDMVIVLTVTSLLRTRLNLRWWRALHWSAYGCWLLAVVHALGTGSDARTSVFLLLTGGCVAAALVALAWRLAAAGPGREVPRAGAAMGAVLALAVIGLWAVWGPLAPGWASRSGTPAGLLAGSSGSAGQGGSTAPPLSRTPSGSTSPAAAAWVRGPYIVYLAFTERGLAHFTGPDGQDGRLRLDGGTISLGTADVPRLYTGRARTNDDGRGDGSGGGSDDGPVSGGIAGVLRDATGDAVAVRIALTADGAEGTLRVTPDVGRAFDEETGE